MEYSNPFRLFFPIGWLFAVIASGSWVAFLYFNSTIYPGQFHADLMFGGFLLSFIVGFLMTAIPRFTDTPAAGKKEMLLPLGCVVGQSAAMMAGNRLGFWIGAWLILVGLARYGAVRFVARKSNPPFSFLFVGLGLFMGIIGFSLLAIHEAGVTLSGPLTLMGRSLSFQGMVLSLVLGVGGRLIPGIMGFTEIVQAQRAIYEAPKPFLSVIPLAMRIAATSFILSFPLEFFVHVEVGRLIRALVVGWFSFRYWRLMQFPRTKTAHTFFIWLSSWMILLGSWLFALWPSHGLAGLHLIFIGGFSLITLMIGARVVLAHGTSGMGLEAKWLPYTTIGVLILLAALTRLFAEIDLRIYMSHLGYAALCFLVGVITWGIFFIPKIVR